VIKNESRCWDWPGAKNSMGYGQVRFGGRVHYIHRLSYEIHSGPIPDGFDVCHRCDNPICSNPAHLFAAPHVDNMLDASRKGRMAGNGNQRGAASSSARLTEADVMAIRQSADTIAVLADMYHVDKSTIGRARSGKTWACIAEAIAGP
jgi:hypothetical protein